MSSWLRGGQQAPHASTAPTAPVSADDQRKDFLKAVKQQGQLEAGKALVAAASEACVEPCADKKFNGTLRMDCMSKCVDRYLEASIVVSESYKDKVAELTGVELP